LLFALKIIYPKKVFFVRGNHEVVDMNRDYGFREECLERFGSQDGQRVWISVNETFEYLSLGALVGKHVFCVHGGIGPNVMNTPIEEINHIEKPIRLDELAESNPRVYDIIHELLWSDPASDDETTGFTSNKRGSAVVTYGADIVRAYCQAQNLDIIVRAHECTEAGYDFFAGGRLITVFSATNYCGTMGNAAAFLLIDEDLTVFPKTIKPSNHPRAWPETQTRPPSPTRRRRSRSE
jgi:protein phosphatase/serine/threonine-protein phosphatase BSU1